MGYALPDIQAEPTMLPVAESVMGVDKKGIAVVVNIVYDVDWARRELGFQ